MDRYHSGQNLAEAVQLVLARILTELKQIRAARMQESQDNRAESLLLLTSGVLHQARTS
jgi:hypothetical protein